MSVRIHVCGLLRKQPFFLNERPQFIQLAFIQLQGMDEVRENMDTVFARFGYHPVYGIFVQLQNACGGPDSIALGYATDNHLDSLCRVF